MEFYNFVQGMAPFTLIFGLAVLFITLKHPSAVAARRGQPVAYGLAIIFIVLVILQSFVMTWDTMVQLGL